MKKMSTISKRGRAKKDSAIWVPETDFRVLWKRQGQSTREERAAQREILGDLQRHSLDYAAKYWSAQEYKETTLCQGNKPPMRVTGNAV